MVEDDKCGPDDDGWVQLTDFELVKWVEEG